jgi:cytochrome c2
MVLGADDRLYVSAGDQRFDGISDPFIASQAPDTCFGKILRFDPDSGKIEEIARGLRNSQGLTFDSSGKLWATEHGPRGGGELNLIESGGNYGWPYNTFGTSYDIRRNWPLAVEPGRHRQFRRPVFAWLPSVGPSAILQVAGTPAVWSGDLLMGSLAGAALHRLRIADGNVVFEERIPLGERVRDLVQLPDGRFIVWTDSPSLLDLQVVDKSDDLKMPVPLTAKQKSLAVGDALARCAGCHALGRSESSQYAPSLWQVYGRPIASTDFPGYSASLKKRQGVWDHVTLYDYLADPQAFSPGTTMSRVPEMSGQTRTALIDYLQSLQ